ncbi:MAG TPA: hypothetical protein PK079_13310 [Leptospiraceae bacterium]|nr:hypothetical protein [Leptospiraceae bacterium]HMX31838.1 hypothetical protein [Leptospiraceae bacterium]HMY29705.1 hypothetical protein [Leptospiraceae bacterium]HMZ64019.1 hypothetical protein [Leptospiraceae bacterium]HNA07924.1 hypothetical protein [Leptospiraceae bacterium]
MLVYRENEPPVNYMGFLLSLIFLFISLFIFYSFKGEPKNQDSFLRLANLKSKVETGVIRTYTEPVTPFLIFIWKKVTGLSYSNAYQTFICFTLSLFLHMIMLVYRKNEWRLNHYFLVYLVAFLPFTIYLPLEYLEEMVCLIVILLLQVDFKMENPGDLFKLITMTILAFMTHLIMFMVGYTVFAILNAIDFMNRQKAKPTVFYKKKNVAGQLLLVYLITLIVFVIIASWFKFFGLDSFHFLWTNFWDSFFKFFPIFVVLKILEYLLRKEKELNTLGTTGIVILLIVVSGYFMYKAKNENIDYLETQKNELLSLKARGKILQGQAIYGYPLISDYMYFYAGETVLTAEVSRMKKDDFLITRGMVVSDKQILERSIRSRNPLFFPLDKDTLLIGKELIDFIMLEKANTETKTKLFETLAQIPPITPYTRMNKAFSSLFGL